MTPLRSLMFIPGDSVKKLAKADTCGADAVILDLEDAVAEDNKPAARMLVGKFLQDRPKAGRKMQIWVRVNPLGTGLTLDDLVAVIGHEPDGIMQPKTDGPADVEQLSHYIDALEVQSGIDRGKIKIIPVATETAIAPFSLGEFAYAGLERLAGLTWGAEDLAAAVGGQGNRMPDGSWMYTYQMVRAQVLLAAHAAGVPAIDTLFADFRDEEGLRAESRLGRAEGFSGRLVIHPAQVVPVNESFSPSKDEVAMARKIVAAFEAQPGTGAIGIDGKMYDIPHLKSARTTIVLHEASQA
ncbi:CoA ester lyase [Altererythrobacter aquiaggeris]|uniref:HpcH/HpaI aldolase/citrate lyase family protein n=1 Tax=Aestuarierythrobacter aquiaggeris TaxID=1898396 RepID=UPI003017B001